jgi:cytochrome P450
LARAQSEVGDLIRLPLRDVHWFLISHPDDVERVLKESHQRFDKGMAWENFRALTGEGLIGIETPGWLERRRLAQPAFVQAFHSRYAAEVTRGLED